jgi:hypothetical protein
VDFGHWRDRVGSRPDYTEEEAKSPARGGYEFFFTKLQAGWVGEILPQTRAIVSKTCSKRKEGF